ncbi:hypothetical protein PMAYCL1PPCAC_11471, partial [Pristionchus mayeri]
LAEERKRIGIDMVEVEHNLAFRFRPFDHVAVKGFNNRNVEKFVGELKKAVKIVEATVTARGILPKSELYFRSLLPLPLKNWAGVGGVSYIPTVLRGAHPKDWSDAHRLE